MGDLILEMKHITKTFGNVVANRDVSLQLYAGEIHALLGENGAGKSTLMNVLTGIYKPDEGQIFYKGKEVAIRSPKQAVQMGIGMVYQHFRLIPTLSVAENVYLYSDQRGFMLSRKKMEQVIAECSEKFNLNVDASAKVWQLSVERAAESGDHQAAVPRGGDPDSGRTFSGADAAGRQRQCLRPCAAWQRMESL